MSMDYLQIILRRMSNVECRMSSTVLKITITVQWSDTSNAQKMFSLSIMTTHKKVFNELPQRATCKNINTHGFHKRVTQSQVTPLSSPCRVLLLLLSAILDFLEHQSVSPGLWVRHVSTKKIWFNLIWWWGGVRCLWSSLRFFLRHS